MRWRYSLNLCGKRLRTVINNGDETLNSCKATLLSLLECYKEIQRKVSQDERLEFEDEYERINELLEIFDEEECSLDDHLLNFGYNKANLPLEAVNDSLATFYNFCDYYAIWVCV